MTFKQTLWKAARVKLVAFAALTAFAVPYLSGAAKLPTDQQQDRDWTSHWSPNGEWQER